MSLSRIRNILQAHLNALEPSLPTQWENVKYKPEAGKAWQRAVLMNADTRAIGLFEGAAEQWTGYLHITLNYPAGQGPKPAEDRARLLIGDRITEEAGHFFYGQVLTGGPAALTVLQPIVRPAASDEEWYSLPVHIPFVLNTP